MIEKPEHSGSGSPTTQALIEFLERELVLHPPIADFYERKMLRAAADALRSLPPPSVELDASQSLHQQTQALHHESRSPDECSELGRSPNPRPSESSHEKRACDPEAAQTAVTEGPSGVRSAPADSHSFLAPLKPYQMAFGLDPADHDEENLRCFHPMRNVYLAAEVDALVARLTQARDTLHQQLIGLIDRIDNAQRCSIGSIDNVRRADFNVGELKRFRESAAEGALGPLPPPTEKNDVSSSPQRPPTGDK
jgi:hypothetical protein